MITDDEQLLRSLGELVSIESVAGIGASEHEPYGSGPARALRYMLELCASFGFRTANRDGRVGWAEIGSGREMVGVLCHLDVVPAGDGWDYPPFAVTEVGGRLYGRGTTDDKGPAVCCVYALKDILDSEVELKRRIRIIFGQNEETGDWADIEYYKTHEELPAFGITPDADYPAIYGEKGIVFAELRMPLKKSGLLYAHGGTARNVVPSFCTATYTGADGTAVTLEAAGRAAHGSTPEDGINAISAVMEKLSEVEGLNSPFVDFYQEYIGWNLHGEKLGCTLHDKESGILTMNAGMLRVHGDDLVLTLDIRNPVTFSPEDVMDPVRRAAAPYGIKASIVTVNRPVFMKKDSPLIRSLVEVYREETGDMSEPFVTGGGTYARSMDNIVAFGPMAPDREMTMHMKNEYAFREDILRNRTIYRRALLRLANEL